MVPSAGPVNNVKKTKSSTFLAGLVNNIKKTKAMVLSPAPGNNVKVCPAKERC
jgi:hypothetical protein